MDLRAINISLFVTSILLMVGVLINGVGFLIIAGDVDQSTKTYELMEGLMSIRAWGFFFIGDFGLYLLAAASAILFKKITHRFILYILAGLLGAALMFLYGLASFETSHFVIHSYRYLWAAVVHLIVVTLGVLAWRMTKTT